MSENRAILTVLDEMLRARRATGLRCALAVAMVSLAGPVRATPQQSSDAAAAPVSVSHPVVEPTAPSAGKALNAALGQLAKDPRDIDALLAAGDAANALGDNAASLGFYSRADQLAQTAAPAKAGKVKAAIAGARLHLDDPVEALRWYADAEKAGADPVVFAADRGLAYDLVGDNAAAVAQYRLALERSTDTTLRDEVTRRLALSLAIGGDRRGAERVLLPLLQRQDRSAWRTHTFVLAVAGRSDEAVSVAHATMPADLADAIAPYLRFMVRLTPAQQAAVASLGTFPRAADIGRDDPRVVAYAAAHPRVPLTPTTPASAALAQAAVAAPTDTRAGHAKRRRANGPAPVQLASAAPAQAEPDIALPPPPPPVIMAGAGGPPAAPIASRTTTPARGGFDLAQVSGSNSKAATASDASGTAPAVPTAPVVPRPVVLSRLDMPASPRRTALQAPAPQQAVPAPQATPPRVATPQPAPAALAPPAPAPVPQPVPTAVSTPSVSAAPDSVTMTSHPVIEATPPAPEKPRETPVMAPPAAPPVVSDGASKAIAAKDGVAKDNPTPDRAARTKPAKPHDKVPVAEVSHSAKDKAADKAPDKGAHAKAAHGKAAKDEADDSALPPCKPVAAAKGHKGKGAKPDHAAAPSARSHHGRKGKSDAKDNDTCAPSARGDRPDGPGGVSRDADSDDSGKARTKGKTRNKGSDSDKPAEKGGRHARYASRIWVEVLTGADRDKMPNEWLKLVHKSRLLKKHKPYLTPWRSNVRLLTGPFDSDAQAQDFIAELRKDGVPGFEWTSPAGQAVDSLPVP